MSISCTPSCTAARLLPPARSTLRPFSSQQPVAAVRSAQKSAFLGSVNALHLSCATRLSRTRADRATAVVRAEISYVMVKPDGVQRGVVGEVITRFEKKGFKLKGLKLFQTPKELAEEHYKDLKERPFYPALVDYIVSGPVVCMVWEGSGVVKSARKLIGSTNPLEAEPGTIRGDFGVNTGRNIVHGSDSVENGERETALWFEEGEVVSWEQCLKPWLYE